LFGIEENVAKKIHSGDIFILFFLLFILGRERSAIKIHIGYANELHITGRNGIKSAGRFGVLAQGELAQWIQ
jgi:hypothetical protein